MLVVPPIPGGVSGLADRDLYAVADLGSTIWNRSASDEISGRPGAAHPADQSKLDQLFQDGRRRGTGAGHRAAPIYGISGNRYAGLPKSASRDKDRALKGG